MLMKKTLGLKNTRKFLLAIACSLATQFSFSQPSPDPVQLLDKAIGRAIESSDVAIVFEAIGYGLKKPLNIFTFPSNQVIHGGFLFIEGNKSEMQLGPVKSISDGNLLVVVDDVSKTMFIDSVRVIPLIDNKEKPNIEKSFIETFGEGILSYEGEEKINGKDYHKIKSSFNNEENGHSYYWLDKQTEQIYLMADWQNNAYDVYWFRSVGNSLKGHDYSINLPEKELETYYGYNVIDHRFVREQLNKNN